MCHKGAELPSFIEPDRRVRLYVRGKHDHRTGTAAPELSENKCLGFILCNGIGYIDHAVKLCKMHGVQDIPFLEQGRRVVEFLIDREDIRAVAVTETFGKHAPELRAVDGIVGSANDDAELFVHMNIPPFLCTFMIPQIRPECKPQMSIFATN